MPKLVFLGTGASVPAQPNIRHDSATWLGYGKRCNILVDCGEGAKYNLLRAGLSRRVDHIFLTHDHFDHVMGLTGLLAMMSLLSRQPLRLSLYGPSTALERAKTLAGFVRSSAGAKPNLDLRWHPLEDTQIIDLQRVQVRAFRTVHHEKESLGYTFRQQTPNPHKVVFTGDTKYQPELIEVASGANWLIANANFSDEQGERAGHRGHLTTRQAAELARDSNVHMLFIQHLSPRYAEQVQTILANVKKIFEETHLAQELQVVTSA